MSKTISKGKADYSWLTLHICKRTYHKIRQTNSDFFDLPGVRLTLMEVPKPPKRNDD